MRRQRKLIHSTAYFDVPRNQLSCSQHRHCWYGSLHPYGKRFYIRFRFDGSVERNGADNNLCEHIAANSINHDG